MPPYGNCSHKPGSWWWFLLYLIAPIVAFILWCFGLLNE